MTWTVYLLPLTDASLKVPNSPTSIRPRSSFYCLASPRDIPGLIGQYRQRRTRAVRVDSKMVAIKSVPDWFPAAVSYLEPRLGIPDFEGLVRRAHSGDGEAIRDYVSQTVKLTMACTWEDWPGPPTPDEVCHWMTAMVGEAVVVQEPAPCASQHEAYTFTDPGPADAPTSGLFSGRQFRGPLEPDIALLAQKCGFVGPPALDSDDTMATGGEGQVGSFPAWRDCARKAGFPTKRLSNPATEILTMVHRVLIAGRGWGPKDPERGKRRSIVLSPKRMSKKGGKLRPRSYQIGRAELVEFGLLIIVGKNKHGALEVVPAWWTPVSGLESTDVWETARQRLDGNGKVATSLRSHLAPASPPISPFASPSPVRRRRRPNRGHGREIRSFAGRK